MGKGFRLFTTGWEWDGTVGGHLVDGTVRDYTISWWDETGRETIRRRVEVGISVGHRMYVVPVIAQHNGCLLYTSPSPRD